MVEDTEIVPSGRVRFKALYLKENIAFRGEDVKRVLCCLIGKMIKPQDIAVLASAGKTFVTVSKMPAVAVISTGTSLWSLQCSLPDRR